MAAGGMAHLTFILMEGSQFSLEYYYCQTSKTSTAYPSEIQPWFYDGAPGVLAFTLEEYV
jgi:hypothetical protein